MKASKSFQKIQYRKKDTEKHKKYTKQITKKGNNNREYIIAQLQYLKK